MLKIAVCDDDSYIVDKIEKFIVQYGSANNVDYKVYRFLSGEELVRSDMRFDIVFLDIMMKKLDGIETGGIIKERDMNTQIVYITSFSDYSMRAHKVHAFDYIEKPITYKQISDVLRDLRKTDMKRDYMVERIRLKKDDGTELLVDTDTILYFEYYMSRKVKMYTLDENGIVIKDTIYGLCERLDKSKFGQPHKGYVVNLKFVKSIDKNSDFIYMINYTELSNGYKVGMIPLSQRKRKEFKEKLHDCIRA